MSGNVAQIALTVGSRSHSAKVNLDVYAKRRTFVILCILAFHIPFGILVKDAPILSTIHAVAALSLGLVLVALDKHPHRLIYVCAYIVGSEVLWRATKAGIFWEFGKYAICFLLLLALLKQQRIARANKVPLLYLALLLPSIIVMPVVDRQMVSFHLSGPLTLAICTMFFSTVRLTPDQIRRTLAALVFPTVSLTALIIHTATTSEKLVFGRGSNFLTSANFGPNQVASILGLGTMAAFLYCMNETSDKLSKIVMLCCAVWLFVQSVFTFSRGGAVTTLLSLIVAVSYFVRRRKARMLMIFASGLAIVPLYFVILPRLDQFTEGALKARYQQSGTTHRDTIARSDLRAFAENPLFGVGPDQSKDYHALVFRRAYSHTEYTRMLAEHGMFGLLALIILVAITFKRFLTSGAPIEKAYIMCFTLWALLFMLHSAMRLAAPAFLFGMAAAKFLSASDTMRRDLGAPQIGNRLAEKRSLRNSSVSHDS